MIIQEIDALKSLIKEIDNAVIIPHKNPDGDAIGSCVGWARLLEKNHVQCTIIAPTDYPDFLKWIPGQEKVRIYNEHSQKELEQMVLEAHAVFCLDFNDLSRIDQLGHFVKISKAKKVMIDHHLHPKDFADVTISYSNICSTCQLVFQVGEQLDWKPHFDNEFGQAIYSGIVTDTGSFKYRSTDSDTHRIASEIKKLGVDTEKIHRNLFDNSKENRLRLLGHLLLNNLVVLEKERVAFFTLSLDDMEKFNYEKGDHEGVVNYALSMKGIEAAAFFREEKSDEVRISFRSKGTIPVNELASAHFNGGGHQNAAGGVFRKGLESAVETFKNQIGEYVK